MLTVTLKRYAFVLCAAVYTAALITAHLLGRFPAPGPYDISRLAGLPRVVFEGKVINFPQTRWGNTRFLMEGQARPLNAFGGRVLVQLDFPLEHIAPGEIIRVRGWLSATRPPGPRRTFDERAYWAGQGTYAVLRVWSPNALDRLQGSGHTDWPQKAWAFHQRFKRFWFTRLPLEQAALICGMTMGSRGVLPARLKEQCVRAGVYHMLVVSGQNMALIIAMGLLLLKALRIPSRYIFWISALPIVFYTCAVGADPPVLRAAAMALAALAASALERDIPAMYPFALAWTGILLCEPEALFGASFQLSFGATASLMAALAWLRARRVHSLKWARWFVEAGIVSAAVHLGIGPLLAHYFQQISLIGFIANWTLFPLSGIVMVAGLCIGTWGVYSPETVPAIGIEAMRVLLQGTLWFIEHLSACRWASVSLPSPSWTVCGIYYALLIAILWKLHHAQK